MTRPGYFVTQFNIVDIGPEGEAFQLGSIATWPEYEIFQLGDELTRPGYFVTQLSSYSIFPFKT